MLITQIWLGLEYQVSHRVAQFVRGNAQEQITYRIGKVAFEIVVSCNLCHSLRFKNSKCILGQLHLNLNL